MDYFFTRLQGEPRTWIMNIYFCIYQKRKVYWTGHINFCLGGYVSGYLAYFKTELIVIVHVLASSFSIYGASPNQFGFIIKF